MKKLAGILLLAAVILTAGCVTTADPIVGNWQTTEPIQYDGYTLSYQVTFDEDGTGEMIYSYSDEVNDYIFPISWEKNGDIYQYCMHHVLTFAEDGRTMTDYGQYPYSLADGAEKFGGLWTEVIPEGAEDAVYCTYVFNEDGTGVETIYVPGGEPNVSQFIWEEFGDNQITFRYMYTYSFEDGRMTITPDTLNVYEEVDGIWVETPQAGDYVTTFEFRDDGVCVCSIYDRETDELVILYKYNYTQTGDNGGFLEERYLYDLTLLEDGTLQGAVSGEILERVSPA